MNGWQALSKWVRIFLWVIVTTVGMSACAVESGATTLDAAGPVTTAAAPTTTTAETTTAATVSERAQCMAYATVFVTLLPPIGDALGAFSKAAAAAAEGLITSDEAADVFVVAASDIREQLSLLADLGEPPANMASSVRLVTEGAEMTADAIADAAGASRTNDVAGIVAATASMESGTALISEATARLQAC